MWRFYSYWNSVFIYEQFKKQCAEKCTTSKRIESKYIFRASFPVECRLICYLEWREKLQIAHDICLMVIVYFFIFWRWIFFQVDQRHVFRNNKKLGTKFEFETKQQLSNTLQTLFEFQSHTNYQIVCKLNVSVTYMCIFSCWLEAKLQPEYENWNLTTNRCQRCYWYIIIISLCTILYIRYLPRQISLLCQSLESSKYICQLKIENMSIHRERKVERERVKR